MANMFTGSEVVDLGIQIEKNGYAFYTGVAKLEQDEQTKKIFEFLAAEEKDHINTFEKILGGLEINNEPESYPGEYQEYLEALAEEHVFTKANKGEEVAAGVTSADEALRLALGFEKDSILLYYEMKNIANPAHHAAIDELIAQEQSHVRKLSAIKKNLS